MKHRLHWLWLFTIVAVMVGLCGAAIAQTATPSVPVHSNPLSMFGAFGFSPEKLLMGVMLSAIMQAAKEHDAVPINSGEDTKIHILLTAAATIVSIMQAANAHQLSGVDWHTSLMVLWSAAQVLGGAFAFYYGMIRRGPSGRLISGVASVIQQADPIPAPVPKT